MQVTTASGNIQYIYDATGVKQKKIISTGTTIEYAGGFIYENNNLKVFPHAEGYVEPNNTGGFNYAYQYTDNLGNIRLTYMDSNNDGAVDASEIIEENNYYPFGLKHKGYNEAVSPNANSIASKFKYNGVELEEGLGIDLYEMDLRQYDPAIARWTSIDPVTHHSMSTYTAFDNNPIYWADPSGADSATNVEQDDFSGNDPTTLTSGQAGVDPRSDEFLHGVYVTGGPEDVIIQNKNGDELGRIVLPGKDKIFTLDTDKTLDEPIVVDPSGDELIADTALDAVGLSFDYAGIVGGGLIASIEIVYFLKGKDQGNAYVFGSFGGGVGLDGELGAAITTSYFNDVENNSNLKSAEGMAGAFSGRSAGLVLSVGYKWSNVNNDYELWTNQKSTKTWETISVGAGMGGEVGAKMFWGLSKILNGGKPIYGCEK